MKQERYSKFLCHVAGLIVAIVSLEGVPSAQAVDLLVVSSGTNQVLRYDGQTGAFIDAFVPAGSGGLSVPFGVVFGPDGNIYASSSGSSQVLRYNGQTGAFIDAFVPAGSGGLVFPEGLVFGPDGNLYVNSSGSSQVLRYNGQTGAFIDVFVPSGVINFVFGPDGNLYVLTRSHVNRYNGTTGAFIDTFISSFGGTTFFVNDLAFGPDGNLYVVWGIFQSGCRRLASFDGQTGARIPINLQFTGCETFDDLVFGPDGNLYVISIGEVLRYNVTTGSFLDVFVPGGSGGLNGPTGMAFTPTQTDFLVVPNASTIQEGNVWSQPLFLNNSARQQLVISATEFAAPGGAIQITGISFRPDAQLGSPFTDTYPQFRLDLSTTQKNVNFFEPGRNPDGVTMTFADNLGLDNITVYDGPLTISTTATGPSSGPNNFDIEINFQRPFIYDPAVGNLLLDMRWPGTANGLVTSFDASSPQITVISTLLATSDFGGMNASTADQFAVSGTVVRFSFTPVEIINDLINFVPITSTYRTTSQTAGCPSGFVGKFSFDARLTNENSSPPISGLIAKVKTLTSGNLLHNADGGNGGVGSTLTVLNEDGYSDGKMIPGEFVDIPFTICLKKLAPFNFFVDVLGLPQ